MICPRCTKNTDGIHTCTPTDGWRKMEERLAELEKQEPVIRYECPGCGHEYTDPVSQCDCLYEPVEFRRIEYFTHSPDSASRIAELEAENSELRKAVELASPVMDTHAGPTRLRLFIAALASAKGE